MLKLTKTYNLQICNPKLVKEWCIIKNNDLTPRDVYPKAHKKVWWECEEGHVWQATISSRANGDHGCPYCAGNKKLTIEFIRISFEKYGYVLKTTEYIGCSQKLDYVCPNGHKHSINWSDWNYGKRCPICWGLKRVGSGHPNWQGGISCEPYCFEWSSKEFKDFIKQRDNYQCQNPDCWRKEGKARELSIHHIDYNKKNCSLGNLIALCNSCNSRANFDREWHTEWYQILMSKRYKHEYKNK